MYSDKFKKVDTQSEDIAFTFYSTGRATELNVTIPKGVKRPKLVICSHGAATNFEPGTVHHMYQPAVDLLASCGFGVIRPLYLDGALPDIPAGQSWKGRISELDELIRRARELGPWAYGLLGLFGHSQGSDTTEGVCGLDYIVPDQVIVNNPAVAAMCLWSPQGNDGRMNDQSWAALGCAMYGITGLKDAGRQGDDYTWRLEPHQRAVATRRAMMIHRGDHDHGGAVREGRFPDPAISAAVCDYTCAVMGAHLLGDQDAHKALKHVDTYWGDVVESGEYCDPGEASALP